MALSFTLRIGLPKQRQGQSTDKLSTSPYFHVLNFTSIFFFCLQKLIEGVVVAGSSCLVVEDVVTSGGSVLETCHALQTAGVGVAHAVVLLDREQGGRGNLQREGVNLTSVLTMTQLLEYLQNAGKITMEMMRKVKNFLSENAAIGVKLTITANSTHQLPSPAHLSYTERAQLSSNTLAKRLLLLMDQKSTNLALSADVSTSAQLLEVRSVLGNRYLEVTRWLVERQLSVVIMSYHGFIGKFRR